MQAPEDYVTAAEGELVLAGQVPVTDKLSAAAAAGHYASAAISALLAIASATSRART